ncbi:UDP-glucuronosyltransferase 2A1-like [Astyanax mexicanus]|uniref:UDP-glucuronosyltransferase 2A1-like n=1 Tax=Astyanax mexicanus TaxID=7994 RepID=UPI0020CB68F2|nr:UDP-glucuronosyltransferase 2A1-like [Astyanax mexicanus]
MERQEVEDMLQTFLNVLMSDIMSNIRKTSLLWKITTDHERYLNEVCEGMLNEELIASLRESRFDTVLYDPVVPCSDLLIEILGLPRVVCLRLSTAYTVERLCGQPPVPFSYVPAGGAQGHLTDQMNFIERVENMLLYIAHTALFEMEEMLTYDEYSSIAKIAGTFLFDFIPMCLGFIAFSSSGYDLLKGL